MSIAPRARKAHHMRATPAVSVGQPAAKGRRGAAKRRAWRAVIRLGPRVDGAGSVFRRTRTSWERDHEARNFWCGKTVKFVYFAALREKTFS
ncbi:hypothetical protein Skr01_46370 [Sphaerisporangium krabiense]|nr:hypothetical protein Skr01_46370 [Sphaerisporangium krabiense]